MRVPYKLIIDTLHEQQRIAESLEGYIHDLEERLRQHYERLSEVREDIAELEELLRSHNKTA